MGHVSCKEGGGAHQKSSDFLHSLFVSLIVSHDVGHPLLLLCGTLANCQPQSLNFSLESCLLLSTVGLELHLLSLQTLIHCHQGTQLLQDPEGRERGETGMKIHQKPMRLSNNLLSVFVIFHLVEFLHLISHLLTVNLHLGLNFTLTHSHITHLNRHLTSWSLL